MKRLFKSLFLIGVILTCTTIPDTYAQVANYVPDYYYANYKFNDDWEAILDWFSDVGAMYSVGAEIEQSKFKELSEHFDKVFPNLIREHSDVYQKCSVLARSLAENYSYNNMEALMWNSCQKSLRQVINKINSTYTVKPVASASPNNWMAPLTVTFDARTSSDPSMETIPTDNFYWYYRDENWVDRPIWQWQVLSYTFEESWKFIVHLVVRSSNANIWVLDWEKNITVNVTPKAADIVVYANTRRLSVSTPLKIWITEGERWVVFDWSLTKPRWWRQIQSHRWTIVNSSAWFSYDSKFIDWEPSYINVPLKWKWTFKVTLTTRDNQNNTVSESYYVYLSDPVTIIKQTPEIWTTSTTFTFDGSSSYSIISRLNTYVWEVFDGNGDKDNGDKIIMTQGKKLNMNTNKAIKPWNYMVRLTVTDMAWNQWVETKNLYIESTRPQPQFTITPTNRWQYPSEFVLDASNTLDNDVDNWYDSLEYSWRFSTDNYEILSTENNNEKMVVQFNEPWKHLIRLTATDQYWKFASLSKNVEIKSTLRPDIELIPWPITWWKTLQFKSTVNRPVWDYSWSFWDGTPVINSQSATDTQHTYWSRWIYSVKLTVSDKDWDENTVTEKAFVWEIDFPIAAYRVTNSKWFYIQSSDVCKIENAEWNYDKEEAYSVDRYSKITINPWISVNTKWTSAWLRYVFEKEAISWPNQSKTSNQFTTTFSEVGCHYVDLTVIDSNVGKQDKVRIWFNVKNALPTIKNVTLTFPQYENNTNTIGFTMDTNSNKSIFDCSWTSNLTIKVTAVDPKDSDWNISRLRFYYYNIDDPDRILEYKESRISAPYVYFVIPKISWEYKFWVMAYDNDWWMVDSDEYLASNPSIYFPAMCWETDVPIVTLKLSSNSVQVWDEVTYTIKSKISSDNEDFQTDRTFYYDFEWDGVWDLVTKKDTATYTFQEAHEDWITPKAAVEYRWKLWKADGDILLVKNGIKPILLYNSIWNTVVFRDLSVWIMQQRQICFEETECEAWNMKYRRTHIAPMNPNELTGGTETPIVLNDAFLWKYDDYWNHDVSIYLKNKYGIEVKQLYEVETSSDKSNWKIAPGVNMITIPETTLTNSNPEIFLSKVMDNTLVMYVNNENGDPCYVDTDISTDSDRDGKTDNDMDIQCNKMAKIKYEPDYESAVWRVYFKNNWSLTFKNFYVTFEWIVMELDDEKKEIYNDITTLFNGIEDSCVENTDLKKSLDRLRKNLNNRWEVTALVITINDQINDWWIVMTQTQKDILDSILTRLSNEDTIVSVWMTVYEKNKKEIMALLPTKQWITIKTTVEWMFNKFEENLWNYWPEKRAKELESIWNTIITDWKKNKWMYDENDFTIYFCNIFDDYNISTFTKKCWENLEPLDHYDESNAKTFSKSDWWWFPVWLKIILIVLVSWLLVMWWVIVFFSIKARLNSTSENDEDEW